MKWLPVKFIRKAKHVDYKRSLRDKRKIDDSHQALPLSVSRVLCLDFFQKLAVCAKLSCSSLAQQNIVTVMGVKKHVMFSIRVLKLFLVYYG